MSVPIVLCRIIIHSYQFLGDLHWQVSFSALLFQCIRMVYFVLDLTDSYSFVLVMMMSSNGNILGFTGPLCREFTGLW